MTTPQAKAGAQKQHTPLYFSVAPGVWGTKDIFVNMYMVQNPDDDTWVLVDTGLKTSASRIKKMAAALFGPESKPSCIILTHGHFDHVGSVKQLAAEWGVPVYAHYLELPYLTGRSSYPPPDPSVGGGGMALMSWMFPKKPIDLGGAINALPEDRKIPCLPHWKWLHTPGHSAGHISLYREEDKTLIAGDAFVTTKAESVWSTMKQTEVVSGPPKYFTPDWVAAEQSVNQLAVINPNIAATGHGQPMYGTELQEQLQQLSRNFREVAKPKTGRYVNEAAVTDASGVLYIPELIRNRKKQLVIIAAAALVVGTLTFLISQSGKKRRG